MYSGKRTAAIFVKDDVAQEAYADYFENNNTEIKNTKYSGGRLRHLLKYFCCF